MPQDTEPLLARMLEPFDANPEVRMLAEQELRTRFVEADAQPEEIQAAMKRLSRPRPGALSKVIRLGAWIAGAALLAMLLWKGSDLSYRLQGLPGEVPFFKKVMPATSLTQILPPDLSPVQRAMLVGQPGELRALLPDDPAVLADDAIARHERGLPPDPHFLEEASRLDPDNAWFPFFQSALLAEEAGWQASGTPPSGWEDSSKQDEAIHKLGEAAVLPRFDSYQMEMMRRRISLLPEAHSVADQEAIALQIPGRALTDLVYLKLFAAIGGRADEIQQLNDPQELRQWITNWKRLMGKYLPSPDAALNARIVKILMLRQVADGFGKAAGTLGLEAERKEMEDLTARLEIAKNVRPSRYPADLFNHASGLASMTAAPGNLIDESNVPSPEDLKPGRLAEHELVWNALSATGSILLTLATVLLAFYRLRAGSLQMKLVSELGRCPTVADRIWIVAAGVILPFLLMQIVVRATPLAGWDWSAGGQVGIRPGMTMLLMIWMLVVLTVAVARWRIGKALRFAGIGWGRRWAWITGATLAALVALLVSTNFAGMPGSTVSKQVLFITKGSAPHYGRMPVSTPMEMLQLLAAGFALIVVLSLSISAARAIFSRREHLLKRVLLARVVVPVWGFAALLLAGSAVFSRFQETRWVKRDAFVRPDPSQPSITPQNYRATQALYRDVIEHWDGR